MLKNFTNQRSKWSQEMKFRLKIVKNSNGGLMSLVNVVLLVSQSCRIPGTLILKKII